jgi:hypothetical protein
MPGYALRYGTAHGAALGQACFRLLKSLQCFAGFPFNQVHWGYSIRGALLFVNAKPCCGALIARHTADPRMIV